MAGTKYEIKETGNRPYFYAECDECGYQTQTVCQRWVSCADGLKHVRQHAHKGSGAGPRASIPA